MKKVLIFGAFDGLHKGHLNFIKQSREQGDHLTIVVTRDSNVKKTKGRIPFYNESLRVSRLKKMANRVVLGEKKVSYRIIKTLQPDIICIGYDQRPSLLKAKEILKKIGMGRVVVKKMRAYKPKIYKSSKFYKPAPYKYGRLNKPR